MTSNKVYLVCQQLMRTINKYARYLPTKGPCSAYHLNELCLEIPTLMREERREKAMRWLGYVQGVLIAKELITLEEAKNLNKP